jgi:hypothetical protein
MRMGIIAVEIVISTPTHTIDRKLASAAEITDHLCFIDGGMLAASHPIGVSR